MSVVRFTSGWTPISYPGNSQTRHWTSFCDTYGYKYKMEVDGGDTYITIDDAALPIFGSKKKATGSEETSHS